MKNQDKYSNFIEKRVLSFVRQQDMLRPGDRVVLGVSGGADSVCLLEVLYALRQELKIELHVAHVNHGVRKEAVEDAAYVKGLCSQRKIPFYLKEIRMEELAKEWKCSPEEAGRKARYDFFEEICVATGAEKIAVAHNMGDCSETMLFHLFRGSGLTGLSGIRPVRGNVIRPILCLERGEIEHYLQERELPYRHDVTNDGDDYTRNRIRHHILPYAEAEIVSGATRNVYEAARLVAQTQDFVDSQVELHWEKAVLYQDKERVELDISYLSELHVVLQKGILRRTIVEVAEGCRDITKEHVEGLLSLIELRGNRKVYLPYNIRGERSYDRLMVYIEVFDTVPEETITIDRAVLGEEPLCFEFYKYYITLKVVDFDGNLEDIPQNEYTKWLNYDKINDNLEIRHRKSGDFFSINTGRGIGKKKLKDYFMDEKIPRKRREELVLVAEGNHVLWLVSYRISQHFKVEKETKKILQISVKRKWRKG